MEGKETLFLELVKEQYDKTGGANGLDLYGVNDKLEITIEQLREILDKFLKERKIVKLNHLNGVSYTLPK